MACRLFVEKRTIVVWATVFGLLSGMTAGSALAQDRSDLDLDDLLAGFDDDLDDDFDASEVGNLEDEIPAWLAPLPFGEWIDERVSLSGSIGIGAVYSYLDHKVPHGDQVGRSTAFGNLTRLDLNGFLQLDVELPHDWKIRAEAQGWYDFVYRIKGRGQFGGDVIDVYEWQIDTGEVYLTGPLNKHVDLTIGRKIVNWGRSDTFRIVDVINPLDNKEPGLVDIEDLRRPKTMLKVDLTSGPWSAQLLVIPEHRFDRNPPCGSDFFPAPKGLPPGCPRVPIDDRRDFTGWPGIAGKLDGRFRGWDFSLYGAYVDESRRVIDLELASPRGLRAEANRFGLVGAAGNWTRGAWLVKFEMAWLTELQVFGIRRGSPIPSSDDKNRIDSMIGLEYYGRDNLAIAIEIVNRHLLDEPKGPDTIQLTPTSRFESNIRISRSFLRERLDVVVLAVGFGERLQNGGLVRLSGDYELSDAWNVESGILWFIGGPEQGLGAFESNDRLYAEIKYRF